MGLAWLVTHATVAGGILIDLTIKDGPGHVIDWSLSLASSVSRLTSVLLQHKRASPGKIVLEPAVQALLREISASPSRVMAPAPRSSFAKRCAHHLSWPTATGASRHFERRYARLGSCAIQGDLQCFGC